MTTTTHRFVISVALLTLVAMFAYLVFAPKGDDVIKTTYDHGHKIQHQADGDVIQHGSDLWTNEGVSRIPGGDLLSCRDTNENSAWIACRMKDNQSGDVVRCIDQVQDDVVGCIGNGVSGRRYDWHQNGYVHRGESISQANWNDKRSVH